MLALGLALASLLVALVTWGLYLASIPPGKVPARPVGSILAMLGSIGAAAAAISIGRAESIGALVAAGFAVMMAGLFLWLLSQRKTPVGELKVSTGDALLPFAATTAEGTEFHTDSLAGRRVLLKFFRGHW